MSEPPLSFSQLRERNALRELKFDTFDQRSNIKLEGTWFSRDTGMQVLIWNSNASVTGVFILYRMLLPNGDVIDKEERRTLSADRSINVINLDVPTGWLISMVTAPLPVIARRGEFFLAVIVRNNKDGTNIGILLQGYGTNTENVSYPLTNNEASISGRGHTDTIVGTDPAVGVEISETVPTNALWLLKSIHFDLVTDATAINRFPAIIFDDGTDEFARIPVPAAIIASLTTHINASQGGQKQNAVDNTISITLPVNMYLAQGYVISTDTTNLQAGDNYSAPVFTIEEWIED